jgi:serine phosphatase RsbU (regulator of sigma subunit)/DNA-binding response OmpR family regulator
VQWVVPDGAAAGGGPVAGRVLVADDNADMRGYLTRLLTGQGFVVDAVGDGAAALEAIRVRPPDLVLADVMMPEVDGFELLRRLRQDEATSTLPVVMLSARAGGDASVALLDLGADDYIVKPFVAADLLARVRGTIALSRVRGRHTRQLSALADTAAVIASGRALDDAVRTITERARLLLDGERAVTVLTRDDQPELDIVVPPHGPRPHGAEAVTAPIVGRRDRPLGTVTVWAPPGRLPLQEQRALLQPIAQILAALAESTWQLEHEQQITATLQRGLLPERLPEPEGLDLAAVYLPATAGIAIGGDWYDAVSLPDGRVALVIGDVAGHDVNAAVTMGQLRSAARAYMTEGFPIAQVVDRLHELATRLLPWSFATCFATYLDPRTGELQWCSAGHPPPVLHEPGAPPRWIDGPVGPPLGTGAGRATPATATLAPGGLLVLYTDGLVEHRDSQLDEGMPALLRRVDAASDKTHLRRFVEAVVADDDGRGRHDDVAVLAVRRAAAAEQPAVPDLISVSQRWTYRSTPQAASAMRRNLRGALRLAGVGDDVVYELLTAASEAVNNAVEHAQNPSHPEVEVAVEVDSDRVLIAVQDFGSWRTRRAAMDRGRGSALMAAAGNVRVVPTATGTTVTIERRFR